MARGTMLSLFDHSTVMAQPWAEAGYTCYCVDLKHPPGVTESQKGIYLIGGDIRSWKNLAVKSNGIKFIAAFPPCDHLAASGARWWAEKGLAPLRDAIDLVGVALEMCEESGAPYLIENPIGRLASLWRKPDHCFDPCDYGDPYTKKTCLWVGGGFVMPPKNRIEPTEGSKMHRMSSTHKEQRSVTPPGFARAVFGANAPEMAELHISRSGGQE